MKLKTAIEQIELEISEAEDDAAENYGARHENAYNEGYATGMRRVLELLKKVQE